MRIYEKKRTECTDKSVVYSLKLFLRNMEHSIRLEDKISKDSSLEPKEKLEKIAQMEKDRAKRVVSFRDYVRRMLDIENVISFEYPPEQDRVTVIEYDIKSEGRVLGTAEMDDDGRYYLEVE